MAAEASPQGLHSEHRFYPHAPIVEAILELQFAGAPPADIEAIRALANDLASTYPIQQDLTGIAAEIQIGPEGVQSRTEQQQSGLELKDSEAHRVVRVLPSAISLHEHQVYQGWSRFLEAVRHVLDLYFARFPRQMTSRIGLRYINRLDIPFNDTTGDLRTWIRSAPDIPEGLPQYVSTYSVQMAMPQSDLPGIIAVVRQALVQPTKPEIIPIILDIDIYCGFPVAINSLWLVVDMLHERENLIFERTITDRVRDLIS